ncbi:MAG: hypothetical protein HY695_04255 [Deltaproteobacteria bacterium]|nr:hypothetical protein [Deltaproteobacteria bacterium]
MLDEWDNNRILEITGVVASYLRAYVIQVFIVGRAVELLKMPFNRFAKEAEKGTDGKGFMAMPGVTITSKDDLGELLGARQFSRYRDSRAYQEYETACVSYVVSHVQLTLSGTFTATHLHH